jgi:two-component system, sensor histidine kinase YesM
MRNIWRSSVARSLFGGFIFLLIPSLLISFIANYYSMTSARDVVIHSYENYMTLLDKQLDDRLDRFQSLVQVLLTDSSINYINEYPLDDADRIQGYVKTLQQLQFLTYSNEFEGEITVYLKNKNRILTSRLGVAPLDKKDPALLITNVSADNGRWYVTESAQTSTGAGKRLTYILNPNSSVNDTNTVAKIDVNTSSIQRFLLSLDIPGGGGGFLIDGKENIIEGGNPYGVNVPDIEHLVNQGSGEAVIDYKGRKFQILTGKSATTGLKLVMYFPQDLMAQSIFSIRNWLIVATALSVLLSIVFTFFTYKNLLMPIQKLIGGMRRVSTGDLKTRIPEDVKEDFGFAFHQFNSMTGRIEQLVNEVYVEKIKNQQAHLDFLQSQMNPHFLYNCLYTVYHLINSDDKQAAGNMTLYLGDYFRLATRMKKETVSVREEMKMIETYINIQKVRYPEKIGFHVAMDESIMNVMIPRLIIQPIVENAIIHGLEKANRNGSIWVAGVICDDGIRITVEDDGRGIDEDKMIELQRSLATEDDNTPGYGLINTHRRIRLSYGPLSGLHIERREPSGVRVTMILQRKEEG